MKSVSHLIRNTLAHVRVGLPLFLMLALAQQANVR